MKKHSFTLVELLAVIAIIGILSGILIPVVSGVQTRGKITQAKSDMKTIETAIDAFAADNGGRYMIPITTTSRGPRGTTTTTKYYWGGNIWETEGNAAVSIPKTTRVDDRDSKTRYLICELSDPENNEITCSNNKRKIRYLEPSKNYNGEDPSKTDNRDKFWPDPWGNAYTIWICTDSTGKMTPHRDHNVYSNVLLWSWGPNGRTNNGANAETDDHDDHGDSNDQPADDVASWHK